MQFNVFIYFLFKFKLEAVVHPFLQKLLEAKKFDFQA